MLRLFIKLDRRRSNLSALLEGEAALAERFIAAAAWSEDKEGERGDGGLGRDWSGEEMEIRLGRAAGALGDGGSVFRSGAMAFVWSQQDERWT